jgi:hypothetical protein
METQVLPAGTQVLESIQSFGQETAAEAIQPANMRHGQDEISDNGLEAGAQILESLQSFGQETAAEAIQSANMRHGRDEISDNGLDCFCEVFVRPSILAGRLFSTYYIQQVEDQLLFCDGACKKWFHVWSVYSTSFHHYLSHACS